MFNKIFFVLSLIASSSVFAYAHSVTSVDQQMIGHIGQVFDLYSGHMYYVQNTTGKDQIYVVCYLTKVCDEGGINFRQISFCDPTFILSNNQTKQGNYTQVLRAIYSAVGFCNVKTYTFIHGGEEESSIATGLLKMVNTK